MKSTNENLLHKWSRVERTSNSLCNNLFALKKYLNTVYFTESEKLLVKVL